MSKKIVLAGGCFWGLEESLGDFYGNKEERKEAENFIGVVNKSKRWKDLVMTSLEPLDVFYPAEDYHQDYLQKNPSGYTCHAVYFDSYLK